MYFRCIRPSKALISQTIKTALIVPSWESFTGELTKIFNEVCYFSQTILPLGYNNFYQQPILVYNFYYFSAKRTKTVSWLPIFLNSLELIPIVGECQCARWMDKDSVWAMPKLHFASKVCPRQVNCITVY